MSNEAVPNLTKEDIFRQLAEYTWEKDKEYQGGLSAILGPSPSPSQVGDLTIRAQCYFMSRKKGIPIDFDGYKAYLSSHTTNSSSTRTEPTYPSPLRAIESDLQCSSPEHDTQLSNLSISPATPASTILPPQEPEPTSSQPQTYYNPPLKGSWQHPSYTPTPTLFSTRPPPPALTSHDLLPPSNTQTQSQPPPIQTTYADPSTAPYPTSFPEIIALIQSGQPIPGIKDIPDTVLWGQGGDQTVRVRRKPWEMHLSEEEVQVGYEKVFGEGDRRGEYVVQEYPEEDGDSGGGKMPPPKAVPDWKKLKKVEERVPSWQIGTAAAAGKEGEK